MRNKRGQLRSHPSSQESWSRFIKQENYKPPKGLSQSERELKKRVEVDEIGVEEELASLSIEGEVHPSGKRPMKPAAMVLEVLKREGPLTAVSLYSHLQSMNVSRTQPLRLHHPSNPLALPPKPESPIHSMRYLKTKVLPLMRSHKLVILVGVKKVREYYERALLNEENKMRLAKGLPMLESLTSASLPDGGDAPPPDLLTLTIGEGAIEDPSVAGNKTLLCGLPFLPPRGKLEAEVRKKAKNENQVSAYKESGKLASKYGGLAFAQPQEDSFVWILRSDWVNIIAKAAILFKKPKPVEHMTVQERLAISSDRKLDLYNVKIDAWEAHEKFKRAENAGNSL